MSIRLSVGYEACRRVNESMQKEAGTKVFSGSLQVCSISPHDGRCQAQALNKGLLSVFERWAAVMLSLQPWNFSLKLLRTESKGGRSVNDEKYLGTYSTGLGANFQLLPPRSARRLFPGRLNLRRAWLPSCFWVVARGKPEQPSEVQPPGRIHFPLPDLTSSLRQLSLLLSTHSTSSLQPDIDTYTSALFLLPRI